MHAFILAGGFATRLWPLTERRAKPLLPLAGKPLIEYILEQLSWDIPVTASINASFEESFLSWKARGNHANIEIIIEDTHSDTQKLGALGATARWITLQGISEDVLLITGDNYFGFSFKDFLTHFTPGIPLIAAHNIGDLVRARSYGTIVPQADSKRVEAFEEKPIHPRSTLVSTGCSIIPKEHLPLLVEYAKAHADNVGGIFEEFLRKNIPVEFRSYAEPWFDIGSFETYLEATKVLVGDRVLIGDGATCENTETQGSCVIGKKSRVERSILRNVILFEGCIVKDCTLENCILDDQCSLEGIDLIGKMLREKTILTRK